jgi:hypothetical protein
MCISVSQTPSAECYMIQVMFTLEFSRPDPTVML